MKSKFVPHDVISGQLWVQKPEFFSHLKQLLIQLPSSWPCLGFYLSPTLKKQHIYCYMLPVQILNSCHCVLTLDSFSIVLVSKDTSVGMCLRQSVKVAIVICVNCRNLGKKASVVQSHEWLRQHAHLYANNCTAEIIDIEIEPIFTLS